MLKRLLLLIKLSPTLLRLNSHVPKLLEDACFRTTERLMIKASLFIKGYSLKKGDYQEHGSLKRPHRAGLETL